MKKNQNRIYLKNKIRVVLVTGISILAMGILPAYSGIKHSFNEHQNLTVLPSNFGKTLKGTWKAIADKNGLDISFTNSENIESSSSSSSFNIGDFSALMSKKAEAVVISRVAGKIIFNGNFSGLIGTGEYNFFANEAYVEKLKVDGITDLMKENIFTLFLMDIKEDYVTNMGKYGCKITKSSDLITFSALKITPDYVKCLSDFGYDHLANYEIISAKASGIDQTYLAERKQSGKEHISIFQLIALKSKEKNKRSGL